MATESCELITLLEGCPIRDTVKVRHLVEVTDTCINCVDRFNLALGYVKKGLKGH